MGGISVGTRVAVGGNCVGTAVEVGSTWVGTAEAVGDAVIVATVVGVDDGLGGIPTAGAETCVGAAVGLGFAATSRYWSNSELVKPDSFIVCLCSASSGRTRSRACVSVSPALLRLFTARK